MLQTVAVHTMTNITTKQLEATETPCLPAWPLYNPLETPHFNGTCNRGNLKRVIILPFSTKLI